MVELVTPRYTPQARAAGQVSSAGSDALANVQRATQGVANQFTEFYEKEAEIQRGLLLAQTQADWSRKFAETAPDAGPGFAASMAKDYEAYVANALKTAPERGRRELEAAFTEYGMQVETRAFEAEAAARARAKAAAVAEAKRLRAEALANEKRMTANGLISDTSGLQAAMDADPENAEYYANVALDARMRDDPVGVRDEVQDGKWDNYLSPSDKLAYLKNGDAAEERIARDREVALAVEQQNMAAAHEEEELYAMMNGAPPVDAVPEEVFRLAYGDNEAAADLAWDQHQERMGFAETLYGVNTASISDIEAQIAEVQNAVSLPGNTAEDSQRLNLLAGALDQRNKAITEDASAFTVANSDETRARLDAYGSAEPESRGIAAQGFMAAQASEYDRLGIPDDLRRTLPKAMAQAQAAQFNEMPADMAGSALNAFTADWGESVVGELAEAGLNDTLTVAARITDPGLQAKVTGLRNIEVDELKKGLGVKATDAEKALETGVEDYRAVFEAGGDMRAAREFNSVRVVAEKLAYQYVREGMDADSAGELAAQQLFPESVLNETNAQVIVPKQFSVDAVTAGLDRAMSEEAITKFAPAGLNEPGLEEFQNEALVIEAAQNGVWLTNSKGDGAVLHIDVGGYLLPVLGKDGNPYQMLFSQVSLAPGRTSIPNLAGAMR